MPWCVISLSPRAGRGNQDPRVSSRSTAPNPTGAIFSTSWPAPSRASLPGRLRGEPQFLLEPGDLLAQRLLLLAATGHLHLDAADLHRVGLALGLVLDGEDLLLVLAVGLLQLAQALPGLGQLDDVGRLLRVRLALELLLELA